MKKIKIYAVLILLFAFSLNAQNFYNIPLGSSDNNVSIKIINPKNEKMENVTVRVASKPEWITFDNDILYLTKLESKQSEEVKFTFSVNSNAPLNEEGIISFNIEEIKGQQWQKLFKVQAVIPDKFELMQNYPNPFNPVTTIKFSLPQDKFVKLKVFNILGETVQYLLNEEKKAGLHTVQFNASSLSSGVYFYSIEAGDFKAVRKMLLMK